MADKACVKRLQKEYRSLCKEPVSHVTARPSPTDILEWRGHYYGKIKFPSEYPYKPPGILMITPNGRFMTQKKICLSMSDFHPERWNPMWSVSSILTGLLSFMMDSSPTTGSVSTTDIEKKRLAKSSHAFNGKNPTFRKIFPEYMEKYEQRQIPELPSGEVALLFPNPIEEENGHPLLKKLHGPRNEEERNNKGEEEDVHSRQGRRRQSIPTWILALLISVLGIMMALPLLQA